MKKDNSLEEDCPDSTFDARVAATIFTTEIDTQVMLMKPMIGKATSSFVKIKPKFKIVRVLHHKFCCMITILTLVLVGQLNGFAFEISGMTALT